MGTHIAARKCPHVHASVVESVSAALRAITGNGVNVLAMGAFYVAQLEAFDYDEYKKNGFKMEHLGDLTLEEKAE